MKIVELSNFVPEGSLFIGHLIEYQSFYRRCSAAHFCVDFGDFNDDFTDMSLKFVADNKGLKKL